MSSRTILSVLVLALLLSSGCGSGNRSDDEGRAILRGVVVDGNPYVNDGDVIGYCYVDADRPCSFKNPLLPAVAGVEVSIRRTNAFILPNESTLVARVSTDSEGKFAATLPPGFYEASSDMEQQKVEKGFRTVNGYAKLSNGDDKSVVIGNAPRALFPIMD